jgi:hypothetical protein
MPVSPSTDNYYIGKGVVSFMNTTAGESEFRDVGNVPEFELTPALETLDHNTSREGVKKRDKRVVTLQSMSLRMVMEEVTAQNLALAMMGAVEQDTAGNSIIRAQTLAAVEGRVKFVGTNDVGLQLNYEAKVSFTPSSSFSPISDEWGSIEVTGEILAENGALGVWTIEDATDEVTV